MTTAVSTDGVANIAAQVDQQAQAIESAHSDLFNLVGGPKDAGKAYQGKGRAYQQGVAPTLDKLGEDFHDAVHTFADELIDAAGGYAHADEDVSHTLADAAGGSGQDRREV